MRIPATTCQVHAAWNLSGLVIPFEIQQYENTKYWNGLYALCITEIPSATD